MKKAIYISLLVSITLTLLSCSKKEPGPCDCEGQPTGQKCREILYDEKDYIGHTDFKYNSQGWISEQEWITTKGQDKKSDFEYNAQGQVVREDVTYSDGKTTYWEYVYNESGQLGIKRLIENGVKKRVFSYFYWENGLLKDRVLKENDVQLERNRYTYDSDDEIWRIEEFDGDNRLKEQRIYQYFSNNTQRIDLYDGDEVFIGYTFINETSTGIPLEIKTYDADDKLLEYTLNDVRTDRLNRSSRYDANGNLQGRTVYLYY